jgi:hypothetical protein
LLNADISAYKLAVATPLPVPAGDVEEVVVVFEEEMPAATGIRLDAMLMKSVEEL